MATISALDAVAFSVAANRVGETLTIAAGDVMIMTRGSHLKKSSGSFVQIFTVDEIRTSA